MSVEHSASIPMAVSVSGSNCLLEIDVVWVQMRARHQPRHPTAWALAEDIGHESKHGSRKGVYYSHHIGRWNRSEVIWSDPMSSLGGSHSSHHPQERRLSSWRYSSRGPPKLPRGIGGAVLDEKEMSAAIKTWMFIQNRSTSSSEKVTVQWPQHRAAVQEIQAEPRSNAERHNHTHRPTTLLLMRQQNKKC